MIFLEWAIFQIIGGILVLWLAWYFDAGHDVAAGIEYFGRKPLFILFWFTFWPAIMLAVIVAIITKPN